MLTFIQNFINRCPKMNVLGEIFLNFRNFVKTDRRQDDFFVRCIRTYVLNRIYAKIISIINRVTNEILDQGQLTVKGSSNRMLPRI